MRCGRTGSGEVVLMVGTTNALMHQLAQIGAILSGDGRYRYAWHRPGRRTRRPVRFVMLNPSTADAHTSDHTLTRCQRYAEMWGLGPVLVGNLFAWRATAPHDLWRSQQHHDIVGPDNERWLDALMDRAQRVVVGWGDQPGAAQQTTRFLHRYRRRPLTCLGATKSGAPKHPSRPAYATPCVPFIAIQDAR